MSRDDNKEEIPFLSGEPGASRQSDDSEDSRIVVRPASRSLLKYHCILFIIQTVLIVVTVLYGLYHIGLKKEWRVQAAVTPFSPASSAISYHWQNGDRYGGDHYSSPFVGPPTPELDAAWSEVLRPTLVRLTAEEMRKMNRTSVALQDGGYIASTETLHMLHCVKRLYEARYPEYYPHVAAGPRASPRLDHCIEVLRQGIMCNADAEIYMFEWTGDDRVIATYPTWPRKCMHWDSFLNWTYSRIVDEAVDIRRVLVPSEDPESFGPVDLL